MSVDGSYLDFLTNYDNGSGTVPYGPVDNTSAGSGALLNTAVSPVVAPADASGGNGSYLSQLQSTLTGGLIDTAQNTLDYALGSLNDRIAVNAAQLVTPAAAPAKPSPFSASNLPLILLVGGGILLVVVLASKH